MTQQQEFLKNAQEAALWMLERESNPPKMFESHHGLRFEANGLLFQYQRAGNYADDNPWVEGNHTNKPRIRYDEGLVVIAQCPRHGGERRSGIIPTRPLSDLEYVGKLLGCSHCSAKKVVVRDPGGNYTLRDDLGHQTYSGRRLPSVYCRSCAKRLSRVPETSWSKKPLRFTEEEFRIPTRRALAEYAEWAKDVECSKCVRCVYMAGSGGGGPVGTYPYLERTYRP
jgi:hypothetical protein